MTLRLRQICLVAPQLEAAVDALRAIFGLEVCHRDAALAKYGLVNALFVFGHQFLEVVAPTRADTAAGRFLRRGEARGGYIAIFDTHDPERRRAHVEGLGLRVAQVMVQPGFFGIQLHPRDCRAAMLEFDRSEGNDSIDGAYWPAGTHWQDYRQAGRVAGIARADVASPRPEELAAHWARIIDQPLARGHDGAPELHFELGALRFVQAQDADLESLHTLQLQVADPPHACEQARALGCTAADENSFWLCGMRFALRAIDERGDRR